MTHPTGLIVLLLRKTGIPLQLIKIEFLRISNRQDNRFANHNKACIYHSVLTCDALYNAEWEVANKVVCNLYYVYTDGQNHRSAGTQEERTDIDLEPVDRLTQVCIFLLSVFYSPHPIDRSPHQVLLLLYAYNNKDNSTVYESILYTAKTATLPKIGNMYTTIRNHPPAIMLRALVASFLLINAVAFQQQQQQQQQSASSILPSYYCHHRPWDRWTRQSLPHQVIHIEASSPERKKPKCRCPDDDNQEEEDQGSWEGMFRMIEGRREALFGMMGRLWAAGVLPTAVVFGGQTQQPALAKQGADAKIELPDVLGGMNDRLNKQCLVETLGNRECLVYMEDKEKFLYKGADLPLLLERIEVASKAMATIPSLVEQRKWSAVTGVLTGPMGQLSATMTLLIKESSNATKAQQAAQKVKTAIFAMGTAAGNKQPAQVLQAHETATQELVTFLKSL